MARLGKAQKRDRQVEKRKHAPREDGRSVFKIQEIQKRRAEKLRKERKRKEDLLNDLED